MSAKYPTVLKLILALILCFPFLAEKSAAQDGAKVEIDTGASVLIVGKTKFTTRTDFFVTSVLDHVEDHDGTMPGGRINGTISGLLPGQLGSYRTALAIKGFYSAHEGSQKSSCSFTASSDCAFIPLYDPSPAAVDLSGGFFSVWDTVTKRSAAHFGVAVELRLDKDASAPGGLKDTAVAIPSNFEWRFGVATRELDQKTHLYSVDTGPTEDPVHLREKLNATYYGGYIGFAVKRDFDSGYRLSLSGDGGAYYSQARYAASYSASAVLGSGLPFYETISLTSQAPAFISSLGVSLEKDIGGLTVGVFSQVEWISSVPTVRYNDYDRASSNANVNPGNNILDLTGSQDGTRLGSASALSYTAGVRLSVPFR